MAAPEDEGIFGDEKTEILDLKTHAAKQELPSTKPSAQNAPQMVSKNDSILKIDEDIEEALQRDFDMTEEIPVFDPSQMDEALEKEIMDPKERGSE